MASHTTLLISAATAFVVVGALLPATVSATIYRVVDGAWASGKDFKVGDIFEFVYSRGSNNVVMVDERSYEACTVLSNAQSLDSGDDRILFADAGQRS